MNINQKTGRNLENNIGYDCGLVGPSLFRRNNGSQAPMGQRPDVEKMVALKTIKKNTYSD